MTLTHGSLFSGVGGFDLGADAAGIETLWQCEINKQARSVLAKHWPNVTRYEDVKQLKGNEVKPVDIISFGSPCQDLSIAGKGAGLAGERSGLFHEAIRIAKEMRDATQGQQPRFLIWENVRGALSSNGGDDFAEALEEMAKIGAVDISWRLVNACHFGVPQRRVRVFVVADLGGECAGEILSQPTRLLWHPSKSRAKGQEVATQAQESAQEDRKEEQDFNRLVSFGEYEQSKTASTIQSRDYKYPTDLIVFTKGRRAQDTEDYETWEEDRPSPTLNAFDNHNENRATVVIAKTIAITEREGKPGGGKGLLLTEEMSPTLRTGGGRP